MSGDDLKIPLHLDASGFMAGMAGVQTSMRGLAGSIGSLAVVGAGVFAVREAGAFEESLTRINANARTLGGSMSDLQEALQAASTNALDGAFSQNELAAALAETVSDSTDAFQALHLLEVGGKLAQISGADLTDTTRSLADVLSAYGDRAGTAAEAADVLFAASKATGTSIQELSAAMIRGAPITQELGFSFSETAALSAVLKDVGVDSAETLLKSWLKVGGSGGLPGLLEHIQAGLKETGGATATTGEAMVASFGRGSEAALALIQNADSLTATLAKTSDAAGAVDGSFKGSVSAAKEANTNFRNLSTELGTNLLPAVNGVLDILNKLFGLMSEHKTTATLLGSAVVGLTFALVGLKLATIAQSFANLVLAGTLAPLVWPIVALGAVITAGLFIWKNWDKIVDGIQITFDFLREKVEKFWFLLGPLGFAIKGIMEVKQHWNQIMGTVGLALAKLQTAGAHVVDYVKGVFTLQLNAFIIVWKNVRAAIDSISSAFAAAILAAQNFVTEIKDIGEKLIDGIIQGMKNGALKLGAAVQEIGKQILNGFKSVLGIRSPSQEMMEMGGYLTDGLAIGIEDGASRALASMRRVASDLGASARGALGGGLNVAFSGGGLPRGGDGGAINIHPGAIVVNAYDTDGGEKIAKFVIDALGREMRRHGNYAGTLG